MFTNWTTAGAVIIGDTAVIKGNGRMVSPRQPPGRHVIEATFRSNAWPPGAMRMGSVIYQANGKTRSGGGTNAYPTKKGAEHTVTMPLNMPSPWSAVIISPDGANPSADIEVVGVSIWNEDAFTWKRGSKAPFDRDRVSVTASGLMHVDGEPFVPIGVQANQKRPSFKFYSNAGFNLNIWCASVRQARKTVNADMKYMLGLTPYMWHKGWAYRQWDRLKRVFGEILGSELGEHCIGFYVDNELYEEWQTIQTGIAIVRNDISDQLPIYALQGNYGLAPLWATQSWSDITGTYFRGLGSGGASPGIGGAKVLWHDEKQTNPVVFTQLNTNFSPQAVVQQAGIYANAMSYWGDNERSKIEDKPFWDEMPEFAEAFTDAVLSYHKEEPPVDPPPEPPDEDLSQDFEDMRQSVANAHQWLNTLEEQIDDLEDKIT